MTVIAIDLADSGIAWGDEAGATGIARSPKGLLATWRRPVAFVCNPYFFDFNTRELTSLMAAFAAEGHAQPRRMA